VRAEPTVVLAPDLFLAVAALLGKLDPIDAGADFDSSHNCSRPRTGIRPVVGWRQA